MDSITSFETCNETAEKRPGAPFKCGDVPEGLYSLGGDVFAYAAVWKGAISIHIRKFNLMGDTYYPTTNGVSIPDGLFFPLVKDGFDPVKQAMEYSFEDKHVELAEDFSALVSYAPKTVTFTKVHHLRYGQRESFITLNTDQWDFFLNITDCLGIHILELLYKDVDLAKVFTSIAPLSTRSMDTSIQNQLKSYLHSALYSLLVRLGMADYSDEVDNSVGMFNFACFKVNPYKIMQEFYVQTSKATLMDDTPLSAYISEQFLNSMSCIDVINKVRTDLYPFDKF